MRSKWGGGGEGVQADRRQAA